ncbi:peptidylprolyl isomerase [Chloroflexus sp.]|uniref:peptidylprolyl isomerase n=1 Tax=Chloroflexus sp. TaxID=1904827 RepID=UPI002ACD476D|nr:peptidylprolyl isomerase [Chloroflexus sp.]
MSSQRPSSAANPLAGIVAIAILLLILGLVAGLLISRAAPPAAAPAPTTPPLPTVAAPTTAPTPATSTMPIMPTATTYQYSSPPPMAIDPAKKYTATIYTPRGEIVIELLPDIAPQTVNNFVFLARQNFYNGLTWHRVLPNFMAQGGDPRGDGTGGPGYSIPAEFTDKILFDQPGIVAMARSSDPNSAGSQFFITTAPAPWLNEQYTIFGRVIQGQEIVDGIPLRDPSNPADLTRPGETILGITITES